MKASTKKNMAAIIIVLVLIIVAIVIGLTNDSEQSNEMVQLEYEQLAIDTAIAKMEEALDGAYSVDYKVNEITFSDISVESTNNIDYEVYLRANVNTAINPEFVEEYGEYGEYGESVNHHELILVTVKIIDGEVEDIMYQADPRYAGHP